MVSRGLSLVVAVSAACAAWSSAALAGTVVGKLDLPARPARPAVENKGFLDRLENPYKPAAEVAVAPYLLVVLEGDAAKVNAPAQLTWDLAGESFLRPVVGAPVGAEVVIKNTSKTARTLSAAEDSKLIPPGPINPTAPRSFRLAEAGKIYNVRDSDAAHLHGTLVVTATPFVSNVDDANGFKFDDVPPGTYKLRVFYKDGWLDVEQPVTVAAKGKGETTVNLKVPAFAPAAKK
jgi:hypothetical protein